MRTTTSTSGTTGKTRGASLTTTFAALALALPLSGIFGGSAFASQTDAGPTATPAPHGNSETAQAAAAVKKADAAPSPSATSTTTTSAKPAGFIGPVAPAANQNTSSTPYVNQGGVTTGSNTTKYEVVNGRSGSPAVGGGQPSGSIYSPQPYSNADKNNTGANDTTATNQYASTRNGAPALNGNGGGKQVGQPCAACVGKADNKNPPGQYPNGTDANAGYECDRNHGIGRSNPAHTGCVPGSTTSPTPTPTQTPKPSCSPAAGQDKDCKTPSPKPSCTPTAGQDKDCKTPSPKPSCTPTAGQDKDCKTPSPTPTPTFCPGTTTPMPANGVCGGGGGGGTVLCPGTTTPMPANGNCGNDNDKVTICHATGSATNPFVVITPDKNGVVDGHIGHQDARDIIPPFTYVDHGVTKTFPGQNWTAANQALFSSGCTPPVPPKTCPNGTPMPANGGCGGGGGGITCPNGMPLPTSGNLADCTPPVVCSTTMTGGANGSCTPPVTCSAGTTMAPGNGSCTPPVVCSDTAMVGPIAPGTTRPGCTPLGGNTGGGANGPGTTVTPGAPGTVPSPGTVISNGTTTPQAVQGGTPAPAVVRSRPTALPFTGSSAGLLAEGAALMLLLGAGLVAASRKKAAHTA